MVKGKLKPQLKLNLRKTKSILEAKLAQFEKCKKAGGHTPAYRAMATRNYWEVLDYCSKCGTLYERKRESRDPRLYPTPEEMSREITLTR